MKKLPIVLIAISVIAIALYSQRLTILERVISKGIETRMASDKIAELGDGLHVGLCGAGGPLPAPKASGPCVVVIAGSKMFVVDAGTDGSRNLGRMGLLAGNIEAVFLTHFHSDHIDGLGELAMGRWVGVANKKPLSVYGPSGVENVVNGFNTAYSQDAIYRHAHHTDLVAPLSGTGMQAMPFVNPAPGVLTTLYDQDGIKIEALAVEHEPVDPAVGYRFSYKGRTALISGDTKKSANIEKFAKGIDLLVHEALAPNLVNIMNVAAKKNGNEVMAKITFDILDYHASPVQAAETALDAGVDHLLYYHIVPPLVVPGMEQLWLNGAEDIFEDFTVGEDGVMISLPANSDEIVHTSMGL